MPDRDEWRVDTETNLTPPSDLTPDTDEFGRDDPASMERERRRLEREQRRRGGRRKKEKGGITGGFRKVRRRREEKPPAAAPPPRGAEPAPPAAAPPPRGAEPAPPASEQGPSQPPSAAGRPSPVTSEHSPVPVTAERAAPETRQRLTSRPVERAAPAAEPGRSREGLRSRLSRASGDGGEPSRQPARARRGDRGSNYGRRRFAALAIALCAILLVWFLVAFFQPFAGDGEGSGSVSVEIPDGATAGEIASILDDSGVISSARLFEWRLTLAGKSGEIQADTYALAEGMSYGAAIDRLTGEGGPAGAITVTIPEGLSRDQIASDILPEGVSSEEYLQLTERAPKSFNTKRYGATSKSLEGFLFPATYELAPGQGSKELVDQQLQAFEDNFAQVNMSYAKKKNLTPYDVLIIASMVDKEVQVPRERDDVAAVIYNRLSQGIVLGIDATTRYETQNYTEPILQATFEEDTPYNTRTNAGLTPTPIGNPGLDAMKAAARPANVNYVYFVVKPGTCGEHSFTDSEAEFEKLAAEYQAALEAEGGSPTEC
jgi:uncharacterized YceG family protein